MARTHTGVKLKRKILYLDDDSVCLSLFQAVFGSEYEVHTVTTRREAFLLLAAEPIDVVISDQIMPEGEGTDFLREVAETYPESRRVLLTGGVMVGHVLGEVSTGIVQFFVRKPWTEAEMQEMLDRAAAP